jgi:hypothetical protein
MIGPGTGGQPDPPSCRVHSGSSAVRQPHTVSVDFNNAPQGTRVGVTRSRGVADLNIRTHYAMGIV